MDRINESILATIKKMLGLEDDYTPFDVDIVIHINSALMTLMQIGVGPKEGFTVEDYSQKWSDFLINPTNLNSVKTYTYLYVKMLFDPPTNSFVMEAMKRQVEEILFRLNVQAESVEKFKFMTSESLKRGGAEANIGGDPEPEPEPNESAADGSTNGGGGE